MTEEERDKLKKRKKYLKECLEKIGFPYERLKELGYNTNYLLKILEEILGVGLENQEECLIINSRENNKINNYRSNVFYNFLEASDEKNLNNLLKVLLKEYDEEKYKNIEFDERGNIYSKDILSEDSFIVKVEQVIDLFQRIQETLINKIFRREEISYLDTLIDTLSKEARFDNSTEDRSKEILRIFIIFLYWEWQQMLLENIIEVYKKGLIKVEDHLKNKVLEDLPYEISSINALSKFLNRHKKNKRDTSLKEKLKKIYIYTDRKLRDYSLDKSYPINSFEVQIIDNIFQKIFFSDEKVKGHKLDYYISLYRENYILKDFIKKVSEFIEISESIKYNDEYEKLGKELLLDILEMYNVSYTQKELKEFSKLKIEKEFIQQDFKNYDELKLRVQSKNRNIKNGNKFVEKIYKILILPEIDYRKKIILIGQLLDTFNIESQYVKSEVLEGKYFENVKPLNRIIDTYLSILLNMYNAEELKEELLKIIDLLERFKSIKPKFY